MRKLEVRMTDDTCWQIIDHARAVSRGETHRQAYAIARLLAGRPALEIVAFKSWVLTRMHEATRTEIFTAVQWIHSANGLPDVSGDAWVYRRAWLVGRGRQGFYGVLSSADVLADLVSDFEDFCNGEAIELAAHRAYEAMTGSRDYPDEMYVPNVVESFPASASEDEQTLDHLVVRFPKLVRRFGLPKFL
jgi:hypothetical protein